MTLVELRFILAGINEGCNEPTAIRNHQLQSSRCSPFIVARTVVGVPNQYARNTRVHSRGHHEGHAILDLGVCSADVCNDSISDDGGDQNKQHDRPTKFQSVGNDGNDDCYYGCNCIGDDGPELSFIGCIAELDDDGREEETERVEACEDAEVGECAEPSRDVEDSSTDF